MKIVKDDTYIENNIMVDEVKVGTVELCPDWFPSLIEADAESEDTDE